MRIDDLQILNRTEYNIGPLTQITIIFFVRLNDGRIVEFLGQGFSLPRENHEFCVSYSLFHLGSPKFLHRYYEAVPVGDSDYKVDGYTTTHARMFERFTGVIHSEKQIKESLEDFIKRAIIGVPIY